MPATSRHSWVRVREHVYVCRRCGTGRVNSRRDDDFHGDFAWVSTWHRADGTSFEGGPTPPCEVGTRTAAALTKYEAAISAADFERHEQRQARRGKVRA